MTPSCALTSTPSRLGALPPPPCAAAEFDSRPDGPEWWTAAQTEYEKKMANSLSLGPSRLRWS